MLADDCRRDSLLERKTESWKAAHQRGPKFGIMRNNKNNNKRNKKQDVEGVQENCGAHIHLPTPTTRTNSSRSTEFEVRSSEFEAESLEVGAKGFIKVAVRLFRSRVYLYPSSIVPPSFTLMSANTFHQLRIDIPAFEKCGIFKARTLLMRQSQLPTKSRSKRRASGLAKRGPSQELLSVATVQSVVSSTDHSVVYRATLDKNTVILKCSVPNELRLRDHRSFVDLKTEAQAYQDKLARLCGTVVPKFYGFYVQEAKGLEKPIGCLVLEDCGDCIETFFYELPYDDRYVHVFAA